MRVVFFFLIILVVNEAICCDSVVVRNSSGYPVIESKLHLGKIVKNYDEIPERKCAFLYELFIGTQANGCKDWQQIYGSPQTGVSFYYGGLGNSEILGKIYGIVPSITFGTSNIKRWSLKVNLGMGMAYFNKPYNEFSNQGNMVIGSSITNMSVASFYLQHNLSQNFTLVGGIMAMHCSNGHYKVPNAGLNMPALSIGVKYYPNGRDWNIQKQKMEIPKGKLKVNMRFGIGFHEFAYTFGPVGGPKYSVYQGALYLSKRYGKASNVYTGVEARYYTAYEEYLKEHDVFETKNNMKAAVFTYLVGHELMINKLGFLLEGGINAYNPFYKKYYLEGKDASAVDKLKSLTMAKIGVQYYLFDTKHNNADNIFLGVFVKANFNQADFVGLNMGVVF